MNPYVKLDLSETFGYPLTLEFTPWDQGINWISSVDHAPYVNAYHEDRGLSLAFLLHQPESQDWKQRIPIKLLSALVAFEQAFQGHTFACMWFVSRSEQAAELLLSSPRLMWTLMDYAKSQNRPSDEVMGYFGKKRTFFMGLHGLAEQKYVLRTLEKYQTPCFDREDFDWVKAVCSQFNGHELGRLKLLNKPIANWLTHIADAIHYGFIDQIHQDNLRSTKMLVEDTLYMGRLLRVNNINQQVHHCQTIAQLNIIHDRLVEQLNAGRERHSGPQVSFNFPEPPFEDSEHIIALRTHEELNTEGLSMKHCIRAYASDIISRKYYAYKVLEPERATFGIKFKNGKWHPDQLKLRQNAEPVKETKEAVYEWFANQTAYAGMDS